MSSILQVSDYNQFLLTPPTFEEPSDAIDEKLDEIQLEERPVVSVSGSESESKSKSAASESKQKSFTSSSSYISEQGVEERKGMTEKRRFTTVKNIK